MTECTQSSFSFPPHFSRQVVARFDGGPITSDAGALLLRPVEQRTGILRQFTACFRDYRKPELVEHTAGELVRQRVYGLALGYEDLNDHDQLRQDPLLALLSGKSDLEGAHRRREQDRGKAGAGKSTLNRLELTQPQATERTRYKKIVLDDQAVDRLLVDLYIQAQPRQPQRIVLDLDATDDRLHGEQEGRFFHGYYGGYCYLPLYIFIGEHLVCARLRPSNIDASAGALEETQRIVAQLRRVWPEVEIVLRGDSGFCRDPIMDWCEQNRVGYVFGLAKNERLLKKVRQPMRQAQRQWKQTGKPARVFTEFRYRTRESWSRARRVIAKAEYLDKGENPRFVVTSFHPEQMEARPLYEEFYCARGDMENRIKEQQLALFADRTSTSWMRSNQIRLVFSSIAYCLLQALRRLGLAGTDMAKAQCQTIRLRLLKIGAQVRITARKVWISLAAGYPWASLFAQVHQCLEQLPSRRC
ncbi:MAG: IS1380 family transposase [Bryobacterales bacterium]|nr:IS1380 family transposase [Bryobacterales bacterium]